MNKSHISTVLTCLGAAGVVITAIMSAKAAPKASKLIQKAKEEKGEELTPLETIKSAAPAYIPTVLMGASTIVCIFGSNSINKRYQASMASAYALLDRSYREYTNKVKELYGEESDIKIRENIMLDQYEDDDTEIPEDEQLFYDFNSMQYFSSTIDQVLQKTVMPDGLECYIISTPFDTLPPFD